MYNYRELLIYVIPPAVVCGITAAIAYETKSPLAWCVAAVTLAISLSIPLVAYLHACLSDRFYDYIEQRILQRMPSTSSAHRNYCPYYIPALDPRVCLVRGPGGHPIDLLSEKLTRANADRYLFSDPSSA